MCLCIAPSKILVIQVQIAACDTFRSGAVEQLRTHCNRLNIPLYERGYEKDPAKVAYEAIKSAERSNIDVLLVDTAGENPLDALIMSWHFQILSAELLQVMLTCSFWSVSLSTCHI